jgi:hypothetical protein
MRTVTLCMSIRLTEIMHEHLPAELTLAQSSYPETPCHLRLGVLALGDGTFSAEIGKQAGRLQAQLIYQVVTVYYWYWAQYPVFYAARFSSKPAALLSRVPALRSPLALRRAPRRPDAVGGGDAESVMHGSAGLAGLHVDAGHAQRRGHRLAVTLSTLAT